MSCLFDTLSIHVGLTSQELRDNICNYLKDNPKMFDEVTAENYVNWNDEGYGDLQAYISRMRSSGSWGGAIEIKAFCNMYNKHINVHDVRGRGNVINFVDDERSNRQLLNINWNGGHYWNK